MIKELAKRFVNRPNWSNRQYRQIKFLRDNRASSHCTVEVFSTRLPPEILGTRHCQGFQRVHPQCQYTLFLDARIPAWMHHSAVRTNESSRTFGSRTLILWYRSHLTKFNDDYALEFKYYTYLFRACALYCAGKI